MTQISIRRNKNELGVRFDKNLYLHGLVFLETDQSFDDSIMHVRTQLRMAFYLGTIPILHGELLQIINGKGNVIGKCGMALYADYVWVRNNGVVEGDDDTNEISSVIREGNNVACFSQYLKMTQSAPFVRSFTMASKSQAI